MPDRGAPTSKGHVMSSKPVIAVIALAFVSTGTFAQSAAPPSPDAAHAGRPPQQDTAGDENAGSQDGPPGLETPTPEAGKPTPSTPPKPTSTTGRRPRATAPQTQVVTRDVSGMPLEASRWQLPEPDGRKRRPMLPASPRCHCQTARIASASRTTASLRSSARWSFAMAGLVRSKSR